MSEYKLGRPRYFVTLPSTNNYLRQNWQNLPDGAVVAALRQSAGKGRLGRTWEDTAGEGLALSFLLRDVDLAALSLMPLVCSLAVCDTIYTLTGVQGHIKWPNDVLIKDKKVCGILCEGVSGEFSCAIGGIGINLRQSEEYFARWELPHATSLLTATGKKILLEDAARALIDAMNQRLQSLADGHAQELLSAYRERCVTLGKQVLVTTDGSEREGIAADVLGDGSLQVEIDGEMHTVRSGEASVRGLYGYV